MSGLIGTLSANGSLAGVLSQSVITDPTLSISGMPADAKATGDAIAEINSALSTIGEPITDAQIDALFE